MGKVIALKRTWGHARSIMDATTLIDRGVILQWKDMRRIRTYFSATEQIAIIEHFAVSFSRAASSRAMAERTVESLLVWLTYTADNNLAKTFIAQLLAQDNFRDSCWALIEIALSHEIAESEHGDEIFATSVAFICELGHNLNEAMEDNPTKFRDKELLWNHLATYLLSMSSMNSSAVRLSLLSYFGAMSYTEVGKRFFNRIMCRFGYTVLDHLFFLLFNKKSEAMALEYLLHNLPWVLGGDYFAQDTLHKIFQHYVYRHPERFVLFLRTFSEELFIKMAEPKHQIWFQEIKQSFLKHMASLYMTLSEINHRTLATEFLSVLEKFERDDFLSDLWQGVYSSENLKPFFKSHLSRVMHGNIRLYAPKITRKRGRRPSFSRVKQGTSTLELVAFLGDNEVSKERKAS